MQTITLTTESIEDDFVTCIILSGIGKSPKTQFRETKGASVNGLIFSVYLEMITEKGSKQFLGFRNLHWNIIGYNKVMVYLIARIKKKIKKQQKAPPPKKTLKEKIYTSLRGKK